MRRATQRPGISGVASARARPWRAALGHWLSSVRPDCRVLLKVGSFSFTEFYLTPTIPRSRMRLRWMAGPSLTKRRRVTPKPEPPEPNEPKMISILPPSLEIARIREISISKYFTGPASRWGPDIDSGSLPRRPLSKSEGPPAFGPGRAGRPRRTRRRHSALSTRRRGLSSAPGARAAWASPRRFILLAGH